MAVRMKPVESPDEYQRQVSSPKTPVSRVTTEEAGGPPPRPKIAVFAAHGMGQQIPFQTMDDIARGLLKVSQAGPQTVVRTRTVKLPSGGQQMNLQRIEFDTNDAQGQPVEVHVYEGYWAPLTQGKLSARDVITFLIDGILNGIKKGGAPFRRWLFGGMKEPQCSPGTTRRLVVFLLFLLSLLLFNAVIGAVALGRYVKISMGRSAQWPSDTLLPAISTVITWFCVAALIYGLLLFITMRVKPKQSPGQNKGWVAWNNVLWKLFFVLLFLTIVAGLAILVLIVWERFWPGSFKTVVGSWPMVAPGWWPIVWASLFGISLFVRWFVIQYVGDVAAYISPHKLDRFMDMRQKIRQWVADVAQAIYSAESAPGVPLYDRIGIIGHSLGSVVVYDVLNRLMIEDELGARKLKVADRTRVLVTFGSPLDKVAYLFALQGHQTTDTREALAASVQPLIQSYPLFRGKLAWVNVHALHDIFAGALDFYDDTSDPNYQPGMEVINEVDENAVLPLVAHTEYWVGTKIYLELYNRL
jgi:hypothetical protein